MNSNPEFKVNIYILITSVIAIFSLLVFGNTRNLIGWTSGFIAYSLTFFVLGTFFLRTISLKWLHYLIVISAILVNLYILFKEAEYFYFPIPALALVLNALIGYCMGRMYLNKRRNLILTFIFLVIANTLFSNWLPSYFYSIHSKIEAFRPLINKRPILNFVTLDGKKVPSNFWKGKIVIIDFWFLNCGWCRKKHALLEKLHSYYKSNKNVEIISVIDGSIDTRDEVKKYLSKRKLNFPIYYDVNGDFIKKYKLDVQGFPIEIALNKEHIIKNVVLGIWSFEDSYVKESIEEIESFN